ncbi:MAG: phosphate acyltransferase PlsX [Thermoleophilia bacterium]|nr:phosphate acyltransferase PlsX [Thermoleophilia bacterium]
MPGDDVVVALDAMGGDHAPREPVAGAIAAARTGVRVLLVGDEALMGPELDRAGGPPPGLEVVHAPERIRSEEDGARAVRAKPDASLVMSCRLVAEGRAHAAMSSGHTGAMMAAATLHMRRVPGVLRPGLAVVLPSMAGPMVLLDAGANAECRPEHLAQFALMGRLLAEDVLGIPAPSVGVLSIGEEAGKGTELVQQAYALLEGTPGFVGNVEGRDIPMGTARVVVTDGFTGNVALKLYEGAGAMIFNKVRTTLTSSVRGRMGGLIARPALRSLKRFADPEEYGGAYLLGVRGLAVIGHGNFGERGIANALSLAARGVREGLIGQVEAGLRGAA